MKARWDPDQYGRFADHRSRPAFELLNRIDHPHPARVVDLGCGAGEMARTMQARWPDAQLVGVDSSSEMLAEAARSESQVEWHQADIATWSPDEPVDVIYSNAALHWVADHRTLFPSLVSFLAPNGVLAVQMPLSWAEPSHVLMREVLRTGGPTGKPIGSRDLWSRLAHKWVDKPTDYHDLLTPLVGSLDLWTTRYFQVLEGHEPVFEWVKGTGLRPVLETLDGAELDTFLTDYRERLLDAYPRRSDGTTVYPFSRLFIVTTTRS